MVTPNPGSDDPLALTGVIPPTVTAFDADETVDYEATVAQAEFVVDNGCHAVFTLGTNGEFPLLLPDERREVVDRVTDAITEVPVLAGVGAPGTRQTVAYAEQAAAAGADGLIVVTPFYYPLSPDGAVEHYRRVTAAVDVPVYVYQIPSHAGPELSLSTLDRLAAIDGIAGVKHTSTDLAWLSQAAARTPELTYLAGANELLFAGLQTGCAGVVSGLANAVPELVVELYEAHADGDIDRAKTCQERAYDILSAMAAGPHMAGVKAALSLREPGFDVGPLRSPLRSFDDEALATLEAALAEHGYL